jgi:hypothetical protein
MTGSVGLPHNRLRPVTAASAVARYLRDGDEASAYRVLMGLLDDYRRTPITQRSALVEDAPDSCGDPRYDAFLAALVEHLTNADRVVTPAWVGRPERFLTRWWFPAGLRSLHAIALVESPISFARRGIFLTRGALDRT